MNYVKKIPATVFLLLVNIMVFIVSYYQVRTFENPVWLMNLLRMGAQFNPLTLDKEWYRLFTHMFLHADIPHLVFNMYALFSVGSVLEQEIGTTKYSWVYFLSGLGAAMNSLYWNLFTIGVGASGAIFGLFGFSVVLNYFQSREQRLPVMPILINFGVFLFINLAFAKFMHADNAAHMGGLVIGAMLAVFALFQHSYRMVWAEYFCLPLLMIVFFLLPRFQVSYFRFFEQIRDREEASKNIFTKANQTDDQFLEALGKETAGWDTLLFLLSQQRLPEPLHNDTFKIRRYIGWKMKETAYRIKMIERESFIFIDSIDYVGVQLRPYLNLDYIPPRLKTDAFQNQREDQKHQGESVQVWYDTYWRELKDSTGQFYRIGVRDSVEQWQGQVRDYYGNGTLQMRGSYINNKREGIFIYYSNHSTYESAGRYRDDQRIGKWETFHPNGKLESEAYYRDRYFLKNLWDSTGAKLVSDGDGHVVRRYSNGVIAEEGVYRNGYPEDLWVGYHTNGKKYFEEYFANGRLIKGRSQKENGETYIYDESSLYPRPDKGYKGLYDYLRQEASRVEVDKDYRVKLTFQVTPDGTLTDITTGEGKPRAVNKKAIEILLNGPRWLPAKRHGFIPTDGYASVVLDFLKK